MAKATIKELYSQIRQCLFYMIPEKWESVYLYATVIQRENGEETGEMFFYYFPKSIIKRNPINVYQIPSKFNLDEREYIKLTAELYDLLKKLRHECYEYDKILWSNITISIENVEFLAEYNCDDLINSNYTSEDRMAIWQCKYLDYPMERFSKDTKRKIEEYFEEEEKGYHKIKQYIETFYNKHEHNSIEYNINKNNEPQYIKADETTDFTIVDEEQQYQIKSKKKSKLRKKQLLQEKNEETQSVQLQGPEVIVRNQILKY